MLADILCELAGIDAVDPGGVVFNEPLRERLSSGPVRVLPGVRRNDEGSDMNFTGLKIFGKAVFVYNGLVRDSVVPDERIS